MTHSELRTGKIYKNVLDIDIPLRFTGRKVKRYDLGLEIVVCVFEPVQTEKNKNWIPSTPKKFYKNFSPENNYIQEN